MNSSQIWWSAFACADQDFDLSHSTLWQRTHWHPSRLRGPLQSSRAFTLGILNSTTNRRTIKAQKRRPRFMTKLYFIAFHYITTMASSIPISRFVIKIPSPLYPCTSEREPFPCPLFTVINGYGTTILQTGHVIKHRQYVPPELFNPFPSTSHSPHVYFTNNIVPYYGTLTC